METGLLARDSPGNKGSGAPATNPILYIFSETVKKEGGFVGKDGQWDTSRMGTSLKPLLR